MKSILHFAVSASLLVVSSAPARAELATEKKTLVVEAPATTSSYSKDRPDYLHFKEVVVTREGAQRLKFEITLRGNLPANPKENVSFYIGFDIDSDPLTGGATADKLAFGQDIGVFIFQNSTDSRFRTESNGVEFKGRRREITISGLKVKDDKIVVELRSELFSAFETFKFFVSASQARFEDGKRINSIQVHTTPVSTF
ncbi:MAG: hypothetical protein ACOYM3_10355 [Terrimicrobiaceae bacterium]